MNFDKLEQAIIRYRESLARFRDDREALRALGVTDLPGDAPRCLGTHEQPAPPPAGNLPLEPTADMIRAAIEAWETCDEPVMDKIMARALRAALAVAPRAKIPEVPKVTQEEAETVAMAYYSVPNLNSIAPGQIDKMHRALDEFRRRLIERMGAKS